MKHDDAMEDGAGAGADDDARNDGRATNDLRDEVAALRTLYRRASNLVDPVPDRATRAAVLAAAARAVDARPRDTSGTSGASPFATRRWPWSAAALLVVTLMTGLVVNRAMQDDPDRVTSTDATSAPSSASRASDAGSVVAVPSTALDAPSGPGSATEDRGDATRQRAGTAVERDATTGRPDAHRAADGVVSDAVPPPNLPALQPVAPVPRVTLEALRAAPRPAPRRLPPPPAPVPKPMRPTVSVPEPASPPATPSVVPSPTPARSSSEATTAHDRSAPDGDPPRRTRRGIEPLSPEAWVERIVKLRTAGDATAADREVEALRARYPDFTIPAAALDRPGDESRSRRR